MLLSWASDCEPIAVAPVAATVAVAPFTPAIVPVCAQVPDVVVSVPAAEPQLDELTVVTVVLPNVRPCVDALPPFWLWFGLPGSSVEAVVLRPVDRLLIPVETDVDRLPTPVEVEVDRLFRLLLVVLRPVDSDEIWPSDVLSWLATLNSWLPLIASVLVAVIWPAATLVICRVIPGAPFNPIKPTLTTPSGAPPANEPNDIEPIDAVGVGTACAVTEPEPSATELAIDATAPLPIAIELLAEALALLPTATLLTPAADALVPAASALTPVAPSLL